MDILTLVLAGISVAGAVFFFGGVTQPEWGLCSAILGVAGILYWTRTPAVKRAPADPWIVAGVGAVVFWTMVQALWISVAPLRTVEYILTNAAGGLMLLLARELGWRFRRKPWVAVAPVLVVAALEGLLGLLQFVSMRAGAEAVASATGSYANRNHFAGLLEMVLPVSLAGAAAFWWGQSRHWAGTALLLGTSALLMLGTVVSLSRMGFLAALAGLFVTGVLLLGSKRRLLAIGGMGAVLLVAFLVLPTNEWIGRFSTMAQADGASGESRLQMWKETLPMVRDHWAFGVGMGAYQPALYQYKHVAPMYTVDYAHNDYLQYLAELGLFGFSIAAAVLGRCLYWMAKGTSRSQLVAGAWGTVAAMGLHSIVDFNLYIPGNVLVLAWILGFATTPALWNNQRAGR